MEVTEPRLGLPRICSYAVQVVLLTVVVAIAVLEVVFVVDYAGYQPARCTIPTSSKYGVGGVGIAAGILALAAAAASVWRLTHGRPRPLRALLASLGAGTVFVISAIVGIAASGC